ncbi:SpoIIE family protein phosphatase [Anaerolineales bacterium HSG6]|nr:SpoIIE family protein phosphatase [Anaerolineales bacterium HSG6]MDM8531627.1 SpoIIE family protein phosphatase [Anaerolineales bacterium HSG25]
MKLHKSKANIIIVDDTRANLKILSLMLQKQNYHIRTALDGTSALQDIADYPPDLVLLDIMMPDLSGYEVCKTLKDNPDTANIPVIFISALSNAADKVKAFKVGGVDYITKPFQLQEVLARVRNHLTLRELQSQLQTANDELGQRVEKRTVELVKANTNLKQEIIERRRAEESLRASEETYRTLFEDSGDTIFIFTPDGQVVDINPAGLKLFGYEEREIVTINGQQLFASSRDYSRFWEKIQEQEIVKDFEVKFKHRDGSVLDCLMSATLRKTDDGRILAYQGIIWDITQRKQAERERLLLLSIQRELGIAQEIQESLLPPPEPEWTDLDVICYNTPAREMGGDLYAYHKFFHPITIDGNSRQRYAIAVGDVSGKGMPAALLMAVSLASFRSTVVQEDVSPNQFLIRMDSALSDYTRRSNQNCALVYLEVIPPVGEIPGQLHAANAGCVTPIIKRADNRVEWVEIGGMPLGVGLGSQTGYQELSLSLSKGDMIILSSDGIVEAVNEENEMFSFDRFEVAVQRGPNSNSEEMLEHLIDSVTEFVGYTEPHDDMTIVVIKI